jgi:alkylhydroperoxidase/carboxymuconolactone decarboxylase family protein YurZ
VNICIFKHIKSNNTMTVKKCSKSGINKNEIINALKVALVVGGSIVIHHLRHAIGTLELLEEEGLL